jgi:hypothetical protein
MPQTLSTQTKNGHKAHPNFGRNHSAAIAQASPVKPCRHPTDTKKPLKRGLLEMPGFNAEH